MSVQIQLRRGTALQWSASNPILAIGEMAVELDTSRFKIGNGVDHWNDLPYGLAAGGGGYKSETFILDSTMISNKQVNLSVINAEPSETLLFVAHGTIQKFGVDFTAVGSVVSWTGLGLETIIDVGDILIIQYKI